VPSYPGTSLAVPPGTPDGNPENLLQGKGRPKGSKNRMSAAEKRDGRTAALKIISDPAYRKNLMARLRRGDAGPIENLLWLFAYGKPHESHDTVTADKRTLEVRDAALKALKNLKLRHQLPRGEEQRQIAAGADRGDMDVIDAERA
jgi:hypothetical protein